VTSTGTRSARPSKRRHQIVATCRERGDVAHDTDNPHGCRAVRCNVRSAFVLATHALPLMLGLATFRLAHACTASSVLRHLGTRETLPLPRKRWIGLSVGSGTARHSEMNATVTGDRGIVELTVLRVSHAMGVCTLRRVSKSGEADDAGENVSIVHILSGP
jgi:hypothetical protein